MNQCIEFLSKRLPLFILLVAILTYLSPVYWHVYTWVPSFLLGVVIFFTGLSMNMEAIKEMKTKKRVLFFATLLKWTLTVFLSIGLAYVFFQAHPDIAAGLILSGTVPSATAATLYTFLAGGNTSLVIAASLLDVIISPFATPLAMSGLRTGQVNISFISLLQSFLLIVVLPLSFGMILQRFAKTLAANSKAMTKLGSSVSLLLIIHTLVGSGKEAITQELDLFPLIALATFIQVLLPMLAAYFIAKKLGMDESDARATLFHVGLCNTALAAILAFEFIGEIGAIPPIINMIFNLSIGAWISNQFAKMNNRRVASNDEMKRARLSV
ncbi:bile acid:sodium symporter family protein [bacterium LRH843]|nr:bile acid:sodium symporter family protein [bacterium LRH843]